MRKMEPRSGCDYRSTISRWCVDVQPPLPSWIFYNEWNNITPASGARESGRCFHEALWPPYVSPCWHARLHLSS